MARKAKAEGGEDYPLLMYRNGSQLLWDGREVDMLVVNDSDEENAALSEGWVRSFAEEAAK